MVVILFFEVILFNLEASAQKCIKPPGIWRRVIMVHHQIKFLSQHTGPENNTFIFSLMAKETPSFETSVFCKRENTLYVTLLLFCEF